MLCREDIYLAHVKEEFNKLRPFIEQEFGISLDGIVVKSMRELNTDIRNGLINEGFDQNEDKWLIRIALAMGYLHKGFSFAAISPGMPNNLYVNTYLHSRLRTSRRSIPGRVLHELYHLAHFNLVPDLSERLGRNPESTKIRIAMTEGFACYFSWDVFNKQEVNSLHHKIQSGVLNRFPFKNYFADGYRFFKYVCRQKGNDFALEVLKNPPQSYKEVRNPELYLKRVNEACPKQ